MTNVNDKEFAALLALPGPERYSVFVRWVADWEEVWGLRTNDGWCLTADDEGVELMPVWPHRRFAEACTGAAGDERPTAIPLDDWLDKWLPGMTRDGRGVAVFPTPEGNGVRVAPDRLRSDLLEECEQYE